MEEEITSEIRKYLEMNENKTQQKNLQYAAKAVLKRRFTAVNA